MRYQDEEMIKDAIAILVAKGFEVVNKKGGYIAKDDRFGWYHQTCYRSTHDTGEDGAEALDSFLSESSDQLGE